MNYTNYKLDDEYKTMIREIREKYDMTWFRTHQVGLILQKQNEIREYIHTHYKLKMRKNDYFAFFIALISTDEDIDRGWEYLMHNVEKYMGYTFDFKEMDTSGNVYCCCSKDITNIYTLTAKETKYKLLVGCDCIAKNLITEKNREEFKALKKRYNTEKEQKFKGCKSCRIYTIPANSAYLYCKKCYYEKIAVNNCVDCNKKCQFRRCYKCYTLTL